MTDMTENESTDGGNDNDGEQTEFSKLRQMALKGANFRETYELEYFDDTVEMPLMPLSDEVYVELIEDLDDVFDDEETAELREKAENGEEIDPDDFDHDDDFDPEYVRIMRKAAVLGIDHEAMGETREGIREILDMMVGGVSIEIGGAVMEITSNIQDAQRFRRS